MTILEFGEFIHQCGRDLPFLFFELLLSSNGGLIFLSQSVEENKYQPGYLVFGTQLLVSRK